MSKQNFSKNIEERIRQVAQTNSSAVVRGELMKRNPVFKRELNRAKKVGVHYVDNEWPEFCRRWGIAEGWNGDLETLADHASALPWIYINCDDRAIKVTKKKHGPELKAYGFAPGIGSGKRKTVGDYLCHVHPLLDDLKSTMLNRGDKPYPGGEIYVKIFPWTTFEDLKYLWPELTSDKNQPTCPKTSDDVHSSACIFPKP